jgi:Putative phage metallopeptidase
MPTYEACNKSVHQLAQQLIGLYAEHKPLKAVELKLDLVFAFADTDEKGRILNDALTKNGIKALGITRSIPLKDRALGRGDAEIALDGDWWKTASGDEQAALLDHELHHIAVKTDKAGNIKYDDLNRPLIKLRKHDIEWGAFKVIAERHGSASQERQQAKAIMDRFGQWMWPGIAPTVELSYNGKSTGPMPMDTFSKASALLEKKGAA